MVPSAEPVPIHPPVSFDYPPPSAAVAAAGIAGAGWGMDGSGREAQGLGPGPAASLDDLDFYYDGGGRTEEQIGPDDWPGPWPMMQVAGPGQPASLNRSRKSNDGTHRATGMAGIEPMQSQSVFDWTLLSP